MKTKSSYICLKKIQCYAFHGVAPQENKIGNEYIISLRLKTDISKAIASDQVKDTINYAEVHQIVQQEMKISSQLLEHVSGRIVSSLFQAFPSIEEIEMELYKRNPPMGADIESAGICLQCSRE